MVNGENGPNGDIHVNIGRTVEGIKIEDIIAIFIGLGDVDEILFLFTGHGTEHADVIHHSDHGLVGKLIQLLDVLPLNIGDSRRSYDIEEAGPVDLTENNLPA